MTFARYLAFFGILSIVLVAAGFYVGRRTKEAFGLGKREGRIGLAAVGASLVATLVSRSLGFRFLGEAAFALLLALLISTGLLLIVDIFKLVVWPAFWLFDKQKGSPKANEAAASITTKEQHEEPKLSTPEPKQAEEKPTDPYPLPTRRLFLHQAATGSALLVGSTSAFYGAIFGRHDYQIEEVPVRIPGLSKRLDGYTLVQLSDIHFGLFVGEPELRAAEELVKKAKADRIVLTGDLVDSDPRYAEILGRLVRRLMPLAKDGVVVIPGNHDWYAGVEETMGACGAAGARILRNDGFVVGDSKDGFSLLGVEDVWARRMKEGMGPDLNKALSKVPADLPRVLLCHNPSFFPEAAGKVALQLSGHTHGGQVNLGPLRPGRLVLPFGYVEGMYERSESKLYINRGFGTAGPPARIGAPPEVTKIVLVSA